MAPPGEKMTTLFRSWKHEGRLADEPSDALCQLRLWQFLHHRIASKRLAIGEWPWRSLRQSEMVPFIILVCTNNVSILLHFRDTTTFSRLNCAWLPVTLRCSSVSIQQLKLQDKVTFKVFQGHCYWYHSIGHMWLAISLSL